jgi:hypothetical protein
MVFHGAHRVRCQYSTAASKQNYHCIDRSSISQGVVRPVVVVLRHFATGIIILMRNSHASDRRSRPGVLCDPIWRKSFTPGDCSNGPVIYRYPRVGGEQAEAIYLPSFVTDFDFDCGRAGRVSSVPMAVSIVS